MINFLSIGTDSRSVTGNPIRYDRIHLPEYAIVDKFDKLTDSDAIYELSDRATVLCFEFLSNSAFKMIDKKIKHCFTRFIKRSELIYTHYIL